MTYATRTIVAVLTAWPPPRRARTRRAARRAARRARRAAATRGTRTRRSPALQGPPAERRLALLLRLRVGIGRRRRREQHLDGADTRDVDRGCDLDALEHAVVAQGLGDLADDEARRERRA